MNSLSAATEMENRYLFKIKYEREAETWTGLRNNALTTQRVLQSKINLQGRS